MFITSWMFIIFLLESESGFSHLDFYFRLSLSQFLKTLLLLFIWCQFFASLNDFLHQLFFFITFFLISSFKVFYFEVDFNFRDCRRRLKCGFNDFCHLAGFLLFSIFILFPPSIGCLKGNRLLLLLLLMLLMQQLDRIDLFVLCNLFVVRKWNGMYFCS